MVSASLFSIICNSLSMTLGGSAIYENIRDRKIIPDPRFCSFWFPLMELARQLDVSHQWGAGK